MINWIIEEDGFNKELITHHGNKYLIGNGYMGIRGTLEEYEKDEFPAVNLAGIYDQVGNGWREPLNAPNGLFTRVTFNGESFLLPDKLPVKHNVKLDYRHGIYYRNTVFDTPTGEFRINGR